MKQFNAMVEKYLEIQKNISEKRLDYDNESNFGYLHLGIKKDNEEKI